MFFPSLRARLTCFCDRVLREREREREGEGERERGREGASSPDRVVWRALVAPHSLFQTSVLLLIRCPHGTVLLDMVGLGRMAFGVDVDVAAGVENPRFAPRTNGSARGVALETGGIVQTAVTVRVSRTRLRSCRRPRSRRKLQSWRRRWQAWATLSQNLLAREFWKRTRTAPEETQWLEEHGEAHRGHTEVDQQGDQTHRDREREGCGDVGECQSSERNSESGLRRIKKLRADLLWEGKSMDKSRSHVSSPGMLGGSATPRTTRNMLEKGNRFEASGWSNEKRDDGGDCQLVCGSGPNCGRDIWKAEKNPRGSREGTHRERHQDVRRVHGWIGRISVVVKVQTRMLQAISEWERFCRTEMGWVGSVKGYDRPLDCRRIQRTFSCRRFRCSKIGMFCCCKNVSENWKECMLVHTSYSRRANSREGLRCPAVIMHQRWSGQAKAVGGASWTAVELDGQKTIISAHLRHKGKALGDFE